MMNLMSLILILFMVIAGVEAAMIFMAESNAAYFCSAYCTEKTGYLDSFAYSYGRCSCLTTGAEKSTPFEQVPFVGLNISEHPNAP